ncbi:MAG: response regulator [Ignavibacteriae bacterium]|nr:response regulator [Ignavibacteriota bacterium]
MNPKILLVDDEEHVLSGYKRNLRSHFEIITSTSGKLALSTLKQEGPFAVVVSDYKMPEMNGNQFLSHVKDFAPDTVRMMLTGFADLSTTIEAVNEGNIFRLLTKPCSTDKLLSSINDGVLQFKLINAEKDLLDKTLKGTIKILIDILSTVNPVAFSRVSRFQKFIPQIVSLLNIENKWEVEVSSLLSQIGLVTMPSEILDKKFKGEKLDIDLENIFNQHPQVGKSLLKNIPRMENITESIFFQFHPYKSENKYDICGEQLPIASRILYVLNKFDSYVTTGMSFEDAYDELKKYEEEFDPNVLIALDATIAGIYQNLKLISTNIDEVEPGVVAAADIVDKNGFVLITKGAEITNMMKLKLLNYVKLGNVSKEIKILK